MVPFNSKMSDTTFWQSLVTLIRSRAKQNTSMNMKHLTKDCFIEKYIINSNTVMIRYTHLIVLLKLFVRFFIFYCEPHCFVSICEFHS